MLEKYYIVLSFKVSFFIQFIQSWKQIHYLVCLGRKKWAVNEHLPLPIYISSPKLQSAPLKDFICIWLSTNPMGRAKPTLNVSTNKYCACVESLQFFLCAMELHCSPKSQWDALFHWFITMKRQTVVHFDSIPHTLSSCHKMKTIYLFGVRAPGCDYFSCIYSQ